MLDSEFIRRRRGELGLTQQQAAEAVGYKSRQAWNNIEGGRAVNPDLATAERIADALRCTLDRLCGRKPPKPD